MAHAAGAGLKDIKETLGHSSITITSDAYTRLLPEAELAIAEADELVLDDADPLGNIREINSPPAHAPLTQTAPDEESEAG
ncbi:hypothetical protein [Streptomyces atratus]|uniref:hypothetical protein n=1 Tax=Streptomyces atratus TaxID=1893 RepID=UPI0021A6EE68|nr:hypothetical protein [Streptomyces atratus]MCT2542509.1 hypothetical protein [Streptomyces atratus]